MIKTSRKTLLALGSLLPPEMDALERDYTVIKLWKEADPEAALKNSREHIVGIVSAYNGLPVTARVIEALPNLEIIAQFGAGVDNIDLISAQNRHIIVTNTADALTDDTADIALALIMAVLRRIVEADMYVRVGKWVSGAFPLSSSLGGKKLGIVGMGRIGQAIARRAEAFGMEIYYNGPRPKDVPYLYYADLVQMAAECDILALACIGGAETKHIVNARVLEALGAKGYVVNVARGTVIDQEALLTALANRQIAGAGLDVYQGEPHVPEALFNMDNVVVLPHIGSATLETRTRMGMAVVNNIRAHFEGGNLTGRVV